MGQAHTHTHMTDGRDSPRDLEAAYFDAGYDFVISTDHRGPWPEFVAATHGMTPDPANADRGKDLLWVAGAEIGTPQVHLGAWATSQQVETDYLNGIQQAIDRIRALGGIAVMNHPEADDPGKSWEWHEEIVTTSNYSLVEAFNANPIREAAGLNNLPDAVDLADAYQQVWWIGTDDCHNINDPQNFNRYAIVVQTDAGAPLTPEGILRAADAGRLYIRESADGPEILDVAVAGNTVTIRMADTGSGYDVVWKRRGDEVAESDVGVASEASYTVRGSEGYVRAEVTRRDDGRRAYTQPLFVGNPADLAVAASHPALVDNNAGSVWDAGAATGSFVVDAGAVRQLNGIRVDWEAAEGRRFNYYVETSTSGAFLGEQKRVTRPTWSNQDPVTIDFFDEETRYVRVVITGRAAGPTGNARIREVELFDSTPATTHLYLDNMAGDDANSGLSGKPWRTFSHAKGRIRPRDTLHFAATATPYPPLMELAAKHSGKHAGARTRLMGDPIALTKIDASAATYGIQLRGTRYVDVSYFDIHSATSANMRLQDVLESTTVQNNRLHAAAGRGLLASGTFTAAYNLIHSNASDGVLVMGDTTRAELFNNVIYGNGADGIGIHTAGSPTVVVQNNVVDANAMAALRRGHNGDVSDGHNCLRGSIVGVWQQSGNVMADPQFLDPGSGNFRLQATSPCIDAGLDLGQVADLAGDPIVDIPTVPDTGNPGQHARTWVDIGAHEYQVPCCEGSGGCHRSAGL